VFIPFDSSLGAAWYLVAMSLDFDTLDLLRQNHPAWRLLNSPHAPLIASFLQRVFIAPNERVIAQADLVEALEDNLFALREQLGADAFPKNALDYLNDWAGNDKGWLRKFYRQSSDEPWFDLTPATEKAISWLDSLAERAFVGTESRLLTLFELLKQISSGSETDPEARIAELQQRRDDIDAETARVLDGDMPLLDGCSTGGCVNALLCGKAVRVTCLKRSWVSATSSTIPTRGAVSAPSGIS
jgi:hypothetical protein